MIYNYVIGLIIDDKTISRVSGSIDVNIPISHKIDDFNRCYPIIYQELRKLPELGKNNWTSCKILEFNT